MAVDILTRETQIPIIVGDTADMRGYRRCCVEQNGDTSEVILSDDPHADPDHEELRLPITAATASSLLSNEYALLVALTPEDAIDHAILSPVCDGISPTRLLDEAEIKQIAEALVAEEFNLDSLR